MIAVLITLIVNSLICYGVYYATFPGMVLHPLAKKAAQNLPEWVTNPLFDCIYCMASVHSYLFFTLDLPLIYWPLYILALCGLNGWLKPFVDVQQD